MKGWLQMKRWLKGLAVGLLAIGLAACGDEGNQKAESKPGTEAQNKSELTLEEVFKKAEQANESLKSFQADMLINQVVSVPSQNVEMDSVINMKMDFVEEPFAMYQNMDMSMGEMGSMTTEMYITNEGIYMKNPEIEEWMKLPEDAVGDLQGTIDASKESQLDFSSLQEFIDDFKFEQDDKHYILKLNASGEKFGTLVQDELESSGLLDEMNAEETEVLENMEIHKIEYEIFIDKETFQTTAFNLVMDMDMEVEGEKMSIQQDVQSKINKINEIDEIKVPQEVIDGAVEY